MTIKEVKEMRIKGLGNYEKEQLLDAYAVSNTYKKWYASAEKDLKEELNNRFVIGDQLSLELNDVKHKASKVEVQDVVADCTEDVLYSECLKAGLTIYLKNSVNLTALKKLYAEGSLPQNVADHFSVVKQEKFSITSSKVKGTTKKEEEEE